MRKIIIGVLIGIFLCVSFVELTHLKIEVKHFDTCSIIYDRLKVIYHIILQIVHK